MRNEKRLLLTACLALLGACTSPSGPSESAEVPPLQVAKAATASSDWSLAAEVWSGLALTDEDRSAEACVQASRAFRELHDLESAQGMLELGIRRAPEDPELREQLGDVLFEMGFRRAAEKSYEEALRLERDRPSALLKLARARLDLGLETSALDALDRLVILGEACPETWFLHGQACQARGDYASAWQDYCQSFAACEADPARVISAARLYVCERVIAPSVQARELTRSWLERIVEADPQAAAAHQLLGLVCEEAGERGAAIEHLRRAVEIDPAGFDYVESLACIYILDGQREEARALVERAAALAPQTARTKDLEMRLAELEARPDA